MSQVVAMNGGGWTMQHDAASQRFHPRAEFHQVFEQAPPFGLRITSSMGMASRATIIRA